MIRSEIDQEYVAVRAHLDAVMAYAERREETLLAALLSQVIEHFEHGATRTRR